MYVFFHFLSSVFPLYYRHLILYGRIVMKIFSQLCSKEHRVDLALLVLRLVFGAIFIYHGYGKLFGGGPAPIGMTMFTGMVAKLGFPAPEFFAYAAALSEFLGGIAILLGIWTKVFSVLVGFVMLVAIFGIKHHAYPMSDVDTALLAIVIAVYLAGPGKYNLAEYLGKQE